MLAKSQHMVYNGMATCCCPEISPNPGGCSLKPYSTVKMSVEEETQWKAFGAWLKNERKRRRLSRRVVCLNPAVFIKPVHLQRIEDGETRTRRTVIESLAKAIGFDADEALNRAGFAPSGGPLPKETNRLISKIKVLSDEEQGDLEAVIDRWLARRKKPGFYDNNSMLEVQTDMLFPERA
jgi:helix-turn-helix protein